MNALTSAVVIVASRRPLKCGQQVQANAPFELVRRSPAVDRVFGLQILGGLIEANSIQLRVHRQAMRDVAFTDLQQLNRVGFFGAAARFPDRPAVPVVLDPPDGAAFVRHAHVRFSFLVSDVVRSDWLQGPSTSFQRSMRRSRSRESIRIRRITRPSRRARARDADGGDVSVEHEIAQRPVAAAKIRRCGLKVHEPAAWRSRSFPHRTSSLNGNHVGHHVRAIRALDRSRRQGRSPRERVERSESLDEREASARINDVMAGRRTSR